MTKPKFVAKWYDWAKQIEELDQHLLNSQINPRDQQKYVRTAVRMNLLKRELYTMVNDVAMLDRNLESK